MTTPSRFTVLIERRLPRAVVAVLSSIALLLPGFGLTAANAKPPADKPPKHKVARDLRDEADRPGPAKARWVRDVDGVRQVQAIVVSDGKDPQMTQLRQFVLGSGGSVHAQHAGIQALTVQIPAQLLDALSDRPDVVSVSPNRVTQRTASTLESVTGALVSNVRSNSTKTSYSGFDGSGVGIAILDSGVMNKHEALMTPAGVTRIQRSVQMLGTTQANWTQGVDNTSSLQPGSAALAAYEAAVANDSNNYTDLYGHGTHVAAVAAGRAALYASGTPDTTGIAPNAKIFDVKVLNNLGFGTVSDAIEGIQWVIYHAKEYNIRVLNLSLAAASGESWQTDPLCAAVRSAAAAGITVVVAAGNMGQTLLGQQAYGSITAPGNDPTVITVGSVNTKGTLARSDDTVNFFSSRGPTRGGFVAANGQRVADNLLKPDLVAPGNKIVSAAASLKADNRSWALLGKNFSSVLMAPLGITQTANEGQMLLSGTSVAAPVVAGAAAVLLQVNPGLTPPLVKAILQYTAQPLPGFNLVQQGAGLINLSGAVELAKALRTDVNTQVAAGSIAAGATLLAAGKQMPTQSTTINGQSFGWSRIAFVGGTHLASGSALFTKFQPVYDPRLAWAGGVARLRSVSYYAGGSSPANTFPQRITDVAAPTQPLLTSGVVLANTLAGASSALSLTGVFRPTATLSAWLTSGSGVVLSEGIVLSEGVVLSEGIVLSEGVVLSEGIVLSEGVVLSEGIVLSEGVVLSEGLVFGEP